MLGASNISSATLAVVFQDRSLDVAWWPAMAGFLIWFSWLYIQSTLVRSHSNFVIVSSSKSLTFENSMHHCCYWCNKLLKVQWFKIAQKCDVDGSVMQKSKMGLTRLTCLLLGVSSGGSQAGWISWPFTAARGSGCPSVVSGSQDFLTCHPSMLGALPPLSTHGSSHGYTGLWCELSLKCPPRALGLEAWFLACGVVLELLETLRDGI